MLSEPSSANAPVMAGNPLHCLFVLTQPGRVRASSGLKMLTSTAERKSHKDLWETVPLQSVVPCLTGPKALAKMPRNSQEFKLVGFVLSHAKTPSAGLGGYMGDVVVVAPQFRATAISLTSCHTRVKPERILLLCEPAKANLFTVVVFALHLRPDAAAPNNSQSSVSR